MRKRIGVFISEIAQDYQRIVSNTIIKTANTNGYDTVFLCNYGSYIGDLLYAEGEKSSIYLSDLSTYDGIVVFEDIFDIDGMPDEFYSKLMAEAKCPIVYVRSTRDNCFAVLQENQKSIETMVRHFTDVHGFTDICYMSGKKDAEDAQERLAGFLAVMKEHNIEVNDHMIFHGDYWRYKGEEALAWFMEGRKTYPQAIVCANDYMALSICHALNARGIKVPDDVCVSGFDALEEAKVFNPSLTSLEVDFEGMAERAINIIVNTNNGQKEERIQRVEAKLSLGKSCGCGEQNEYKDIFKLLNTKQRLIDDTKNSFMAVTDYQYTFDFDEYMSVAEKYRRFVRSDKVFVCLTDVDEDGFMEVERDGTYSEQVILKRVFFDEGNSEKIDIKFPRRKILPDEYWDDEEYNNFFVFSLHFKNIMHGYIVAKQPVNTWFDIQTQGYMITLANAIENSLTHKKMEQFETIKQIYQNDALTGILNRRGFDKIMQDEYSKAKEEDRVLAIASIDMDNLKIINDTFGHSEGDRALQIIAKALTGVMREGDACARIGGDEFAALLNVDYPGRCRDFKKALLDALRVESKGDSRYQVEASVGICETTDSEAVSLVACVQIADSRMYEEKRTKKNHR